MADDITLAGDEGGKIIDEPLAEALSKRYLAYALSTITSRALPDVRDGLKPVHRRILYAMSQMGLGATDRQTKSAKVVGQVMGNFHPHGDLAIYDAMVRMAQDFAVRYRLVDGQGNFGNIDGDSPAAMRYTESRLTRAAEALLEGIDEDAVDFRETYDGQDREPAVLPAGWPHLLANGASGIAVGMATNIPPHNAAELIDACVHLVANPKASVDDLIKIVPGPDFPTGGVVVESAESIREAYATGRGGFRLRAKWALEDLGRGAWRVIVSEIPYQVEKSKLIEQLAALVEEKKAPLLGDVRDESAEDVRIVIEPRARTVDANMLMESLFKLSDLEKRISLNMNVLDARQVPRVMGLKDVLQAFLDHRREVTVRRAEHRLKKIESRLEILAGLLIAYLNLDEVIRIIRNEDEPKPRLMARFKLSEVQAEAILNTRLRSLRRLEEMEIKDEDNKLRQERKTLQELIGDTRRQWRAVSDDLKKVREIFGPKAAGGARRSALADAPAVTEMSADAFIAREDVTVVLSEKGWIRALKGHVEDISTLKFKDGDDLAFVLYAETTDKLLLFASDGRAFTLGADKLPGGRGQGEPIRLSIELGEDDHPIALFVHQPGAKRLLAGAAGYGFVAAEDEMVAAKRSGKQVLNVDAKERAMVAAPVEGDQVAVIGKNRKLLIFDLAELPEMTRGKGVKLQTYKDGGLLDAITFSKDDGLSWTDSAGRQRAVPDWKDWRGKRAQAGLMAPRGFSRSGKFRGD